MLSPVDCGWCGQTFDPVKRTRRFCSRLCATLARSIVCTVNHPKSMVGRRVSVFLDESDREALFRSLRDEMSRARQVTS